MIQPKQRKQEERHEFLHEEIAEPLRAFKCAGEWHMVNQDLSLGEETPSQNQK